MMLGRWQQLSTARIYVEDALATLAQLELPSAVTQQLQRAGQGWAKAVLQVRLEPDRGT